MQKHKKGLKNMSPLVMNGSSKLILNLNWISVYWPNTYK